ncbi:MAG TPA: non-homologous end-joining DNA ligase [Pyrinomonadaceae bacterium]|jgi:bifunctional non-homologous end joining protein LigD|nr:non-homologous end-joining DNA ligase [Pyrinomonadaceae bacterium]
MDHARQTATPAIVELSEVIITHPEKMMFPDVGITKGELASYYETISPVMLPHLQRRPITMERFHRGIDAPGFFQKDVSKGFPEWLERVEVPKHGGTVHHPIVTNTEGLLWLANQNSITIHVWPSRAPNLYQPDICVFDLDPSKADDFDTLRAAALGLRDLLAELGLPSWIKTSGSKGFHIAVPLDGKSDFGTVARFAHVVGQILVKRDPDNLTQEFSKVDRGGRILVDTGRNGYSATFAATYTVRARPGAPVSAPCSWEELERGEVGPQSFTLRMMDQRIAATGDLWADMLKIKKSLVRPIAHLRKLHESV